MPAHYPGTITLFKIEIRNSAPTEFRKRLEALPFLAYHVETLLDRRKVCITKPGGKSPFARMKVNDFMVWIYDEEKSDRWRISHDEIHEDVKLKLKADKRLGSKLVDTMLAVCKGAEPSDIIAQHSFQELLQLPGLPVDLILKAYKWIWGQEDCNYPTGEGRWKSMDWILKLRDTMTGESL
jgi:hypothetical protein